MLPFIDSMHDLKGGRPRRDVNGRSSMGVQEPPQLKIEIPANRYDMLCFEGIALMLNIFNGRKTLPNYRLVESQKGQYETITLHDDVGPCPRSCCSKA